MKATKEDKSLDSKVAVLERNDYFFEKELGCIRAEIKHLREDLSGVESSLRAEIKDLRNEVGSNFKTIVIMQLTTLVTIIGSVIGLVFRFIH